MKLIFLLLHLSYTKLRSQISLKTICPDYVFVKLTIIHSFTLLSQCIDKNFANSFELRWSYGQHEVRDFFYLADNLYYSMTLSSVTEIFSLHLKTLPSLENEDQN